MTAQTPKAPAASDSQPRAVLHVDLDGAPHIYAHHGWSWSNPRDPVFESGLPALLEFLEANTLKATFFTIASDLDRPEKRAGLERIVAAGHEIASHSQTHPEFDALSRDQRREELEQSRQNLEQALGVPVVGFRAPSYQIDRTTFELLEETGYRWDSSVFPSHAFAQRLGVPSILPVPHYPLLDSTVAELPLPAPSPLPFHPSYSLILGRGYIRFGLARAAQRKNPLVLLFHLADFSRPIDSADLHGWKSRLYTLSHLSAETKRSRCQDMIESVREKFAVVSTRELLDGPDAPASGRDCVLGISTTHETGAALYDGHKCLAAVSEERLDRVKFSTRYPPVRSIRSVIETSGIAPDRITDIVVGGLPPGRLFKSTLKGQLQDTFEFHGWIDYVPHLNKVLYRAFSWTRSLGYRRVQSFLETEYGVRARIHYVPHHLAHASGAYRTAPFDDALIVTADGVGDDVSLTVSMGRRGRIELLNLVRYPHSFGQFYTACTQLLGFRANRHEGKITGLSGYGTAEPDLLARIKSTIRRSGPKFALDKRYYSEGIVRGFSWQKIRKGEDLFEALQYRNYKTPLAKLIEGETRENVAAVFQKLLEDELEQVIRPYAEQTGARNLALAGGVFANVKVNSVLFRRLGFERVYIFPNMGDGGLGNGAALEFMQARPEPTEVAYWGPEFSDDDLEAALRAAADQGLRYRREDDIEQSVAERLARKEVIARFNGRMEFGPRALGNRSILYSAAEPEANTWLNQRLGRTEFMPFAPIVMEEYADQLFKDYEGTEHACKFMTIILDCTDWTLEHCPAVVHVDGTARPQFCSEATNPSMYRILRNYHQLTDVPVLVNTSFNMHEEPIVCTPEDAVRAFLSANLDGLAIGPFLAWIDSDDPSSA